MSAPAVQGKSIVRHIQSPTNPQKTFDMLAKKGKLLLSDEAIIAKMRPRRSESTSREISMPKNKPVLSNMNKNSWDKKMPLKIMLEPIKLFYGMNRYRKTFNLSFGETLVSFFKCMYFLWLSFPILVPLYVFWPSSLEKFKDKFNSRKLMSFYNSPLY